MRTRGMIAVATLALSATVLTGCGFAGLGVATDEKTESYEVTDKVVQLTVRSGAGDVVVNESDRAGIKVTEKMHWRDTAPQASHPVKGEVLELSYDCDKALDSCWIDYTIDVPKALKVKVDMGAGDITLRSLSGEIEVKTGAGDIGASGLAGKRLSAETGAGELDLKFGGAPDSVEAQTGAGDATLHLPQGRYDVTTDSGVGSTVVKVTDDASAPRKVSVSSGVGEVKILPQ
ncbi:DUF4097 family beta strand repeat-containing protein [Nonomuraea sp. NPDC003804]|uniref:DUF4097 family beta strand repeat-containing protein n=1 Tax=Nonomuraea sp. NPDC003804 TaxID=3154547 RepID=UPI0033BB3373